MLTHKKKKKRKKKKPDIFKKQPLTKAIKELCEVEIETTNPQEGYMDVTLYIKILNGRLKGMTYSLNIDLEDFKEVW